MQWYVKTEPGDVRGPMSKEDAEIERDRLDDAIMFPESIFEETLVLSKEVESVLAGLSSLQQKLIRNAWGDDADVSEFDLSEDELQLAIDMITNLSAKKLITGTFKDGTLHLVLPRGVRVEVKDYVDGDEYTTRIWEGV